MVSPSTTTRAWRTRCRTARMTIELPCGLPKRTLLYHAAFLSAQIFLPNRPGLSKISSLSYLDKDDHPDRGAHPGMGRPPPRSGNSDRQMDKATFANQLRDCGLLFNRRL